MLNSAVEFKTKIIDNEISGKLLFWRFILRVLFSDCFLSDHEEVSPVLDIFGNQNGNIVVGSDARIQVVSLVCWLLGTKNSTRRQIKQEFDIVLLLIIISNVTNANFLYIISKRKGILITN